MTSFAANHYVPVLKIKRGEKAALRQLAPAVCAQTTPLLEIVERTADTPPTQHLDRAFTGLAESVSSFERFFLDARELEPDGPLVARAVFERAAEQDMSFVPVTGMTNRVDTAAALEHQALGISVRLSRSEFEDGNLAPRLTQFLTAHGLTPDQVDLIVDLGAVDDMIAEGVANFADQFLSEVPFQDLWRTFTLSASGFPRSMGVVQKNSDELIDRIEWIAWRDIVCPNRAGQRLPTFSDCAIQHPDGVEGFNPLYMHSSAAVRYTAEDQWLLIKGESTKLRSGRIQFPQLAHALVYGPLSHHYAGEAHCEGCKGVKKAADGEPRHGAPEVWRRLGAIHHISQTIQGLNLVPWS